MSQPSEAMTSTDTALDHAALDHAAARLAAGAAPAEVVAAFEAAARTATTPCGEGTMAWHIFGEGPPLVLLHGGHGSWLHWIRVIHPLAAHNRLLIADMPGYGASADPPGAGDAASDTLAAITEPVAEGVRLLAGEDRVAVAGFSFGGIVATHVARRLGAAVSRLIIIGAMGLDVPLAPPPPLQKVRSATPEALDGVHRTNLAVMMFANPANIDPLAVYIQGRNVAKARIRSRGVSRSDALVSALPDVTAPLTAIYGEMDILTRDHATREAKLAAHRPGVSQHVVPGVGHWAPYEGADEVAALMLEGLGQAAPRRTCA